MPGAGQSYNGQFGLGLLVLLGSVLILPYFLGIWAAARKAKPIAAAGGRAGRGGPAWILIQAMLGANLLLLHTDPPDRDGGAVMTAPQKKKGSLGCLGGCLIAMLPAAFVGGVIFLFWLNPDWLDEAAFWRGPLLAEDMLDPPPPAPLPPPFALREKTRSPRTTAASRWT